MGTAGALHRISRDGPFQGSRVDKRRPLRAVSRVVAGFQTRAPTWHARAAVASALPSTYGGGGLARVVHAYRGGLRAQLA